MLPDPTPVPLVLSPRCVCGPSSLGFSWLVSYFLTWLNSYYWLCVLRLSFLKQFVYFIVFSLPISLPQLFSLLFLPHPSPADLSYVALFLSIFFPIALITSKRARSPFIYLLCILFLSSLKILVEFHLQKENDSCLFIFHWWIQAPTTVFYSQQSLNKHLFDE